MSFLVTSVISALAGLVLDNVVVNAISLSAYALYEPASLVLVIVLTLKKYYFSDKRLFTVTLFFVVKPADL